MPVCQAVQHAHQKGIIHRDVKPSNILITTYDHRPCAKVIDFGVAKALEASVSDDTPNTAFGNIIGTLEYMSPEQAGLSTTDVDTRADIYSLGVVLYELLTGTTPLTRARIKRTYIPEFLRIIREEEPTRPSLRLRESDDSAVSISLFRNSDPRRLFQLVRGDLDWIVMKALETDRARHYATPLGLAKDIQRYLTNQPISTCPTSARYRIRKFVTCNRGKVTAISRLSLTLLAGACTSILASHSRNEGGTIGVRAA
jgi:serine/threonine protein kinase